MQNAELLSDAKYLEGLSGGATEIVSGITSRDKAVFAVNLLYEDAVVSIDGQERRFGQAATLYTSHDSSLAYAIAFSVAPEGSEYPTHWLAIKHRNTKGMSTFRDKLKFDLVNLENKASQCVKEIELLGSIPLGAGTDDIQRLAEFVADATKPGGDKPYWDTWAPARLIKAYEATAQIYGHNALSFYLAANEWVLSRKANKKNFIAVLDLSENAFKVQSQLKQLLFSMYKGK
jgi:hypothetical protein